MARRVVVVCDRCGGEFGQAANAEPVDSTGAPDFSFRLCGVIREYQDLCDPCRTVVVGYVASILKQPRDAVAATIQAHDGGPLPPPATRGKEKGDEDPPELPLANAGAGEAAAGEVRVTV